MYLQSFQSEITDINHIEQYVLELTPHRVQNLINHQHYQITNTIPNSLKQNTQNIAQKIMKAIADQDKEPESIFSKLQFRLKVAIDTSGNPLQEIAQKYEKQKRQIKDSGLKISQFRQLFERECEDMHEESKWLKKMKKYFQSQQEEGGIDDLLNDFVKMIQKEKEGQTQLSNDNQDEDVQQLMDQDLKFDLDKLVQQFDVIGNLFTF